MSEEKRLPLYQSFKDFEELEVYVWDFISKNPDADLINFKSHYSRFKNHKNLKQVFDKIKKTIIGHGAEVLKDNFLLTELDRKNELVAQSENLKVMKNKDADPRYKHAAVQGTLGRRQQKEPQKVEVHQTNINKDANLSTEEKERAVRDYLSRMSEKLERLDRHRKTRIPE